MFFKKTALVVAAVGLATAQRPSNTSICDYYTTAALKNNTAANQMTLLTLVVNTAVIGNCMFPLLVSSRLISTLWSLPSDVNGNATRMPVEL